MRTPVLCKSSKILFCLSLEEESHPCPKAALLFPDCSSLVAASPPFLDTATLWTALWNPGKVMEAAELSWVEFSRSVMSDSLWPLGLQHARPPCPSPTPGVYLNSCRLSQWCHPTISSPVLPFSSHLWSFSASRSFQISLFFTSGGQRIGVSASASVLPMNIQDWFPLGRTGWISLQSKGLSRIFSNNTVQKHQFFGTQLFL